MPEYSMEKYLIINICDYKWKIIIYLFYKGSMQARGSQRKSSENSK